MSWCLDFEFRGTYLVLVVIRGLGEVPSLFLELFNGLFEFGCRFAGSLFCRLRHLLSELCVVFRHDRGELQDPFPARLRGKAVL